MFSANYSSRCVVNMLNALLCLTELPPSGKYQGKHWQTTGNIIHQVHNWVKFWLLWGTSYLRRCHQCNTSVRRWQWFYIQNRTGRVFSVQSTALDPTHVPEPLVNIYSEKSFPKKHKWPKVRLALNTRVILAANQLQGREREDRECVCVGEQA